MNSLYNVIFKGDPAVGVVVFGRLAYLTSIHLSGVATALSLVLLMLSIVSQVQEAKIVPAP